MKTLLALCLLLSLTLVTKKSFADCKEYKIIDHGDRVEAVCVGEPLTNAQKVELEKQRVQELKAIQSAQTQQQNSGNNASPDGNKGGALSQQTTSQRFVNVEAPDAGRVVVESYDIKYIPNNNPSWKNRQAPGEYSVKIVAKNIGRRGNVHFKLKQTDFSGYETESITFDQPFEKDQSKTVTTHLPARQVPFIQSSEWIIEAYKN